jgi:glutathione-specific gamma-glutamylcyclotransferase
MNLTEPLGASDVWVFGYGSLIFRAHFPFVARRVARVHGFSRRFWQSSPDHRGTVEAPGRVVTLIEDPASSVLGVAYRIAREQSYAVLTELDQRERAGYERALVEVEFTDAPFGRARALVYRARAENPGFVANADDQSIAAIVRSASGPSGDNTSYVRQLAEALRQLGEDDPHVFAIERLLAETRDDDGRSGSGE